MDHTRLPRRRTERLVVESLDDELLIYDLDSQRAHSLQRPAAAIWEASDGETSLTDVAARTGITEDAAWSALRQLSDASLLDGALPARSIHSRRMLLRRGLMAGAAGLAATTVVNTIAAPAAAQAGSTWTTYPCESSLECCPDYFCCCVSAGCTQHFCLPGIFCEGV